MARWCHICCEQYTGRQHVHEKVCPGFGHPPRPIRHSQEGGDRVNSAGYKLSKGGASAG